MSEFVRWHYSEVLGEVRSEGGDVVAQLLVSGKEDEAGMLLAAAPELLEALQDALHAHDKHGEHPEWDFARAAIAKALGQ
jgi:hypothetical protein